MTDNLRDIKKRLEEALGTNDFKKYLNLLKKWFSQNLTKEQFDTHARRLISPDKISCHNDFFVAILGKCNIQYMSAALSSSVAASSDPSSAATSRKRKSVGGQGLKALKQILSKHAPPEKRFRTSEPMQPVQLPKQIPILQEASSSPLNNLTVCAKDGLLPDRSTMFGRSLVIAWESGLDEIDERSVDLLVVATRDLLKSIMQSAIQLRRNFMLTNVNFPHLFGVPTSLSAASARNRSSNQTECESSHCVAVSRTKPIRPISLRDLFEGLKTRPDVLPSQAVYSVVLERILCKLEESECSSDSISTT